LQLQVQCVYVQFVRKDLHIYYLVHRYAIVSNKGNECCSSVVEQIVRQIGEEHLRFLVSDENA